MSESPKFHQITKIQISYRKKERSVGIAEHSIIFFRDTEKRYPYVTTAAAQQQLSSSSSNSSSSSSGQLPFVVSSWLLCFVSVAECVCAISVCVHPGCPSLLWLRGFGLGIKLGACRAIVWTAGARMNLERSPVQIVHSSRKFRAVFCQVRSI